MSQTNEYATPAYIQNGCKCGAHRLHKVFRYAWQNPSASRKDTAEALKMSQTNVRAAFHHLRKLNLPRYCPECFTPKLFDGVCQNCGYEPEAPAVPVEVRVDWQSPTNNIHPGNMLGSEVDYFGGRDWTGRNSKLPLSSKGALLSTEISRATEDVLITSAKSKVLNELKRIYPDETVSDEAGRLVLKEVAEFRARYPNLNPKRLSGQIAENVINRLALLHPQLRRVTPLLPEKSLE